MRPKSDLNSESPTPASTQASLTLEPNDARHLAMLCGQFDGHLRQIENRLGISIAARGNQFQLTGPDASVAAGPSRSFAPSAPR